ncbi:hypothetical protein N7478_011739 [Penicillium angulare]|uniref:uncharacterized protein n=1 Tax=Penicillium angulare TaxID=116970 RepID=UPI00253FBB05|nr:uncharacterized protein N7478_011739 [Penicillium angulare]KAJ5261144.1 hypothetical protein N7478_011739 [Penicillium angulare]
MADLPDYVLDPNAVLKDENSSWRHGAPPDYTKTTTHEANSLPFLVENLVKNWEIEASFKTKLSDWRTIDEKVYTFSLNGGEKRTGHHMLEVGTYNALLSASQYYDPVKNDFDESHKSFKQMMPTFAWEVLEVYSGPPVVVFKWRHWGEMKNDYTGYNNSGEKVTVQAHGDPIDIQGLIVAKVNEKLQIENIDVWYDPMEMFNQIGKKNGCPFVKTT